MRITELHFHRYGRALIGNVRHVWYLVLKLLNFGDCQFHLIDFKQNCNEYGAMLMRAIAFMKRAGDVKVEGSKLGYMMRI